MLNRLQLIDTAELMCSGDYRDRFVAEYIQTKIRYEKLKAFNTKIEASVRTSQSDSPFPEPKHDCPAGLLREQEAAMGEYLHILEVRALIEDIDLEDAQKYLSEEATARAQEKRGGWTVCECELSDEAKQRQFLPKDGINYRLKSAEEWYKEHPDGTAIVGVLKEAHEVIIALRDVVDKFDEEKNKIGREFYEYKCSPRVFEFPVAVGETVKSACEDADELGNPVTELVPWEVRGVAYKEGKYYAIDGHGEMYEVNTRYCILKTRE